MSVDDIVVIALKGLEQAMRSLKAKLLSLTNLSKKLSNFKQVSPGTCIFM